MLLSYVTGDKVYVGPLKIISLWCDLVLSEPFYFISNIYLLKMGVPIVTMYFDIFSPSFGLSRRDL